MCLLLCSADGLARSVFELGVNKGFFCLLKLFSTTEVVSLHFSQQEYIKCGSGFYMCQVLYFSSTGKTLILAVQYMFCFNYLAICFLY